MSISNKIHSIDFDRGENSDAPISLDDAKGWLVLTFDDDDAILTTLISQCIGAIEKYCTVAILQKTVSMLADMHLEMELPYGPIVAFTSASIKTAPAVYTPLVLNTDYQIDSDLQFARFIPGKCGRMKLVYDVGYGVNIPADLKLAVLNEIAFRYEQRGDSTNRYAQQNVGISEGAQALANPFIRMAWT